MVLCLHKAQRSLEECKDPLLEESAILLTAWTVSLGWKEGKIVRLAVLYERIDKHSRMPKEHILIQKSVAKEQRPLQALNVYQRRRLGITLRI